ncbi:hypothetical protein HJG60_008553 [Phyllostomus discolor]|uniref:Uncharacterized protein n=1 Tax=Phyllostomus discolor TaxID=89673 RepID=A0A834DLJ3_9CHIR|nr:hypothetical protein HJG60_008553 [Phyllostomus discolor]
MRYRFRFSELVFEIKGSIKGFLPPPPPAPQGGSVSRGPEAMHSGSRVRNARAGTLPVMPGCTRTAGLDCHTSGRRLTSTFSLQFQIRIKTGSNFFCDAENRAYTEISLRPISPHRTFATMLNTAYSGVLRLIYLFFNLKYNLHTEKLNLQMKKCVTNYHKAN